MIILRLDLTARAERSQNHPHLNPLPSRERKEKETASPRILKTRKGKRVKGRILRRQKATSSRKVILAIPRTRRIARIQDKSKRVLDPRVKARR